MAENYIDEAWIAIRASAKMLAKDLADIDSDVNKRLSKIGTASTAAGKALSIGLTAPILAFGAAALVAGQQFDDAMDLIRSQTGAMGEDLKNLETSFKNVWGTVPDDAQTIATAMAALSSRTGATGLALESMTTQALNLARLMKTDVATVVSSTTRLFGDWSIATENQAATLDFMFKVSQKTGISINALMQKVVQFGAPLRQMGFSLEESVTLMGKWEKEGVNAELVLGSLRIAMGQFARANIPMREGLDQTLNKIKELGPGAEATALSMKVFGARAGPDMAAAILEGRFQIDELLKTLRDSPESINAAYEATKGFKEQLGELRQSTLKALEPIGTQLLGALERLMPFLLKGAQHVADLATWFSKLSQPAQTTILIIAGGAALLGPTLIAFGSLITSVKTLTPLLPYLGKAFTLATGPIGIITTVAAGAAAALVYFKTKTADAALSSQVAGATQDSINLAFQRTGIVAKDAADALRINTEWNDKRTGKVKEGTVAQVANNAATGTGTGLSLEAAEAAKAHAEAVKTLTEKLSGQGAIKQAELYLEALKKTNGISSLTKDAQRELNGVVEAAIYVYEAMGQTAPKAMLDTWAATVHATDSIKLLTFNAEQLFGMLKTFKPTLQSTTTMFAGLIPAMMGDVSGGLTKGPSIFESLFEGGGDAAPRMSEAILGAIMGGGDVAKSAGASLGKLIGDNAGKMATKSLASAFTKTNILPTGQIVKSLGGLGKAFSGIAGTVVSGLATAGISLAISAGIAGIKKLVSIGKPSKEELAGREEFAKFEQRLHTTLTAQQKLEAGGENWKMTNIAVRDAYVAIGRSVADSEAAVVKLYEAQKHGPEAVKAAQAEIESVFAKQGEAWAFLDETVKKYGFTIEELGPAMQRQGLDVQAQMLYKEFSALTAAGIDTGVVIGKMSENIQGFVTASLKAGVEIPIAMKPMIEKTIEMGGLVDENGEKITSLEDSGITFAMTMTEGFMTIVKSVEELTTVIARGLGVALDSLPRYIPIDVEVNTRHTGDTGDYDTGPVDSDPLVPDFDTGSQGIQDFGMGTLARLHGREGVFTEPQLAGLMNAAAASGSGGGGTTISAPLTVSLTMDVTGVLDTNGLVQVVQRQVMPMIVQVIEDNVAGQRTRIIEALGVA